MSHVYPHAYLGDGIVPLERAQLNIATAAVLYGLSVYTVFHLARTERGLWAFRLPEHFRRLQDSSRIIGIDGFIGTWTYKQFLATVIQVCRANDIRHDTFVRVSVHVDELVPGTRSRGLHSSVSMFAYDAQPIVPTKGVRLKTSAWRRLPDTAIPSRAKVNGAYVNSVLGRQEALDSGCDDCVFLDANGHVCELSAANIFLVRNNELITPHTPSDLLEGINRRSVLQLARDQGYVAHERVVDLTELYIADEVFVCGTSAFLSPVLEIDARRIGDGKPGLLTRKLSRLHARVLRGDEPLYREWLTDVA